MKWTRDSYRWIALAAGFTIILVGYAMRNTFSVFYPVIVSDFGWTRGSTALMYSLTLLVYGLFAPVAGGLADRFQPRYVLAMGGVVVGSGIALCSTPTSVWHFYIIYGIIVAVGTSLIGITPVISVVSHWFGSNRGGLVFGVLGAGFGVSLVTAPMYQWLIATYGWRSAYLMIGLCAIAIIAPVSLLFIRRSPHHIELLRQKDTDTGGSGTTPGLSGRTEEWTVRRAFRTRSFKLFLLIGFCNMGFAQQVTIAHQVYFLQDVGYAPMVAASMFGVFGVAFASGNLSSPLSDRYGRVPFVIAGCLSTAGSVLLLRITPNPDSAIIPLLFAFASGWGLGVVPPACFAAMVDRFHGRNYGSIHGTMILFISLGGAVGPWLGGQLHDISGSYFSVFTLVQAFLIVAAVLIVFATRPASMRITS
ncbi:MAG: MFS transporter [Dehalococcoidia bacterium]|nr:MFS transporter [Dehalococcoidia bacterium]